MRPRELEDRTRDFFAAIIDRNWSDVLERIHPEARAMQNISGEEVDARELLQSMRGLVEALASFAYENPRRIIGENAVVEQHDVRMVRPDGREIVVDVCIALRFDEDGRIRRIDEYLDSAAIQGLLD